MQTTTKTQYPALRRLGSQIGYGIAIGISLVLIYIVQNLEEWNWPPFITDRFGEVVSWISFSLVAGIVANLAYMRYGSRTVRWAGEAITSGIAILVTWRVLTVFPFDFSSYEFEWDLVAKAVLVIAIVGASIGLVTDVVKLVNPDHADRKGASDDRSA